MPLSSGIAMLWDGWNEVAENTLALLFVPLLCFWVGGRMEGWSWRRRGMFFAVFFGGSLGWRWRRFSTSGFCPLG
jgi:hypothetical protein